MYLLPKMEITEWKLLVMRVRGKLSLRHAGLRCQQPHWRCSVASHTRTWTENKRTGNEADVFPEPNKETVS